MNTKDIVDLLKTGTPQQLTSFVEAAPENSMKALTLGLIGADNRAYAIIALTSMIMEYCNGKNPEFGARLAEAAHVVALEIYNEQPEHGEILITTLTNLAYQHLNALNYMGRSQDVVNSAERYLKLPGYVTEKENYPSLVIAKANALLNLNRIDECGALLRNLDCSYNLGAEIEKGRLLQRIDSLTVSATATESSAKPRSLRNSLLDAFSTTRSNLFDSNHGVMDALKSVLANEEASRSLDPENHDDYNKLLGTLDQGEAFLSKGSAKSELTMRKKTRDATAIFHPGAPAATPEQIKQSQASLDEVYHWAKQNTVKDLLNDTIWGKYLCHSRLQHDSEAADALIELRTNLESQRAGITDPIKRGGAFSTYPQLFNALCEKLQNSGRNLELLEAMEASKGRAIADILTRKQNSPVPDADVYAATLKLQHLTRQHQFNYLSYYLDRNNDQAIIYAVLVSKDGQVYGSDPVRMDERTFDIVLLNINPANWGKSLFRGKKIPNASSILKPLLNLVEDLYRQGVLADGDHICYTADDQLNNVPLHYLPFKGKLLIEYFTVSRIHNASQLSHVLNEPIQSADHAEVFIVPTVQDTNGTNWVDFAKNIAKPAKTLSKYMKTDMMKYEHATLKALKTDKMRDSVIHFSTHGIAEIAGHNPYTNSGLVLSDGQNLPDRNAIAKGDLENVLTPKKVVESGIDLKNSHVSMMACVSGLSREGLGGDALGLDWALVNAGAQSVLSSHWFVRAAQAALFFELFYDLWLNQGQSKAMALKNTITTLHRQGNDIYQMCAYSLSGDWR